MERASRAYPDRIRGDGLGVAGLALVFRCGIMRQDDDTQGALAALSSVLGATARRLSPGGEAAQKAKLVAELGADRVLAVGNGVNDAAMLWRAALRIAVLGGEGLSVACLTAADVVAPDIGAGLDLLLWPRRLLATLRT